jgi:hypothetical protein
MFGKATRFGSTVGKTGMSIAMNKEKRADFKAQAVTRAHKAATNVKSLSTAACTAHQVKLNSQAIATMGKFIETAFPDKTTGTVFKKKVQGFHSVAGAADCDAIYAAARNAQEAKIAAIGGRTRRGRRRRKSRRKRRKSRKKRRQSRRKRKKSRRRRRRR